MADKVTWFELPADNVERAGEFYKSVFAWEGSPMPGGSIAVLSAESDEQFSPLQPGSINGDISPRTETFTSPLVVITVDDIEAKLKMVEAAGGSVALPPTHVDEMGMIWAIIADTEGNRIGIIQNL
jgi:predicted enzyme related to lactoylglutathione lyase